MTTPPSLPLGLDEPVTPASIIEFISSTWPTFANSMTCRSVGEGSAEVSRLVEPHEIRPGRVISGPAQFAIADVAMWFAVIGVVGFAAVPSVTSELSIRFLRPGLGDELHSTARLDSVGAKTFVGSINVWTTDKSRPIAVAQGTYVLPAT